MEEFLEVVDDDGNVISLAPRSVIHGNPSLMHRVVHVLVFNKDGDILLQRRSLKKDVAAGKWDTSVGGHVDPGEKIEEAAKRELLEELGIEAEIRFLYSYRHTNPYETELVYTFMCTHNGEFYFNKEEIDEVRFWSIGEIKDSLGNGLMSDNFEHEFSTYLAFSGH